MLKKTIALVLLILIFGSVSLSLIYVTLPSLQVLVKDIYHGVVYLVQSQSLWMQIVLEVYLIGLCLLFVGLVVSCVGGIFLTPEMSWGERFYWLVKHIALFIGLAIFILLCLPLQIMMLKFLKWVFPMLLVYWGIGTIWWVSGKIMTLYKTWYLSKSRRFSNLRRGRGERRRAKSGWW